jgi:hypothetical protein
VPFHAGAVLVMLPRTPRSLLEFVCDSTAFPNCVVAHNAVRRQRKAGRCRNYSDQDYGDYSHEFAPAVRPRKKARRPTATAHATNDALMV